MSFPLTFTFNVAYTLPANPAGTTTLARADLWQGIKRGGRHPNDFADYVHDCAILSGGRRAFRRRLTLADGAVHTAKGETLDQDVVIAEGLYVEATTVSTGAKSTFHLSSDAADGAGPDDLYLTAMYELKLAKVQAGSEAARKIESDYAALARGACASAVAVIRKWKLDGSLARWRREDEVLDRAEVEEEKTTAPDC